jgi:hypothetical protein
MVLPVHCGPNQATVEVAKFSPDGKMLASAGRMLLATVCLTINEFDYPVPR